MTNNNNNNTDEEKVPIIKNWLDRKSLQLIKTFKGAEQETCKIAKGLFSMLNQKFKQCHNQKCYCYSIESSMERVMNLPRSRLAECKQWQQTINAKIMIEG